MSEVKVNKISPRTACGTVTLGDSGDTIAIGAGVTTTGMGRTGTVDWITTVKVTGDSPITGVTGKGYFLNTTSGAITVNLPAGAAGSILAFKDYAGTWDTNAVTVTPDGSEKVAGVAGSTVLSTERQSVTLIYIDSTQGWLDIHDSTSALSGPKYVTATGGTPCAGATSGDYKIHTFTGPGTLVVSCGGNSSGSNEVDYLVVGGGGSGGAYVPGSPGSGGGGGAGGFRESVPSPAAWTASPIASPGGAIPVTATPYAIVVGGGAPAVGPGPSQGIKGSNSSFSTITSTGGGYGGNVPAPSGESQDGGPGGSGGGGGGTGGGGSGGTGDDPSTTPDQGFPGGDAVPAPAAPAYGSGAGGGATEAGVAGTTADGGRGGAGATTCITASPLAYAGGGGGAVCGGGTVGAASPCGTGGVASKTPGAAGSGTTNRGGGGGGHGTIISALSGAGGSGVVVIRYKFQ